MQPTNYHAFITDREGAARIDPKKVAAEVRLDGKFVLRTNTTLSAEEVAVQYKRLLQVERFFRKVKSVVDTRPIYHQWDATITGHVFASFLALVLLDELERRFREREWDFEWNAVRQDLEALSEVEVRQSEDWYLLRTALQGVAGVAVPPPARPAPRVVLKN